MARHSHSRSQPQRARPTGQAKRKGSPRARLFVALDLTKDSRGALSQWRDRALRGRDELRPVSIDALHMTLVFLGYQRESDIDRIAEVVVKSVEKPREAALAPRAVLAVPRRGPRLFALDLDDQEQVAHDLFQKTSQALADTGFYKPEKRPFWAHITLARIRRGFRGSDFAPQSLPPALTAGELTLYRSHLRPEGAHYEALAKLELTNSFE